MMNLVSPHVRLPRSLLTSPGAFAWWYVDILDAAGNGAVLIWSFGLPFLPGLRHQAPGPDANAGAWPALNVAVYRRYRPAFYSLLRFAPESASWSESEDRWSFGSTTLRRQMGERVQISADLNLELPDGGRVLGSLALDGPARLPGPSETQPLTTQTHDWSPLMTGGRGRLELEMPAGDSLVVEGDAYHDRNGGTAPLWEMGIDRWLWGRASGADATWIYYLLWGEDRRAEPQAYVLRVDANGETESVGVTSVALTSDHGSLLGAKIPRVVELELESGGRLVARTRAAVDDGPFYFRGFVDVEVDGEKLVGMGEGVHPGKIDIPWQRPFVRMRVSDLTRRASLFAPLFVGARAGRFARLLASPFAGGGRK